MNKLSPNSEGTMEIVLLVVGLALCIGCMAMMGAMALGGVRRLLRRRDER